MHVHTFIADSAPQAVEQIRAQLGPEAVVLNVRKLPAQGLARLWQRGRIEVLATLPEPPAPAAPAADALAELRQELAEIRQKVGAQEANPGFAPALEPALPPAEAEWRAGGGGPGAEPAGEVQTANGSPYGGWRVGALLERSGLLPVHVHRVLDELRAQVGTEPPAALAAELEAARAALLRLWRSPGRSRTRRHVFIGPPGVGKTTVLSKWLAQAVLVEGQPARVWRLDGPGANTAESLSVLAEILSVPIERFRPEPDPAAPLGPAGDASAGTGASDQETGELVLVDLPGVNANDPGALKDLSRRLEDFAGAQTHLVLNAAYEGPLLLAQARAFSALPIADLILTHLDEEFRWGKVWNLVLGTNYTVGFLSAGQNVPGDFHAAEPDRILARYWPRK